MPNSDDPQQSVEIPLTYNFLRRFVQDGLHLRFDETPYGADRSELNIIILRGAKPVSGFGATPPNSRQEIAEQLNWQSQRNNRPIIRLVNNIHDEYNDITVFAWKDPEGNENVKAFLGSADPGEDSYADLRAGERGNRLVAHIGAGQHNATWDWHYTESQDIFYECLILNSEGAGGVWISPSGP